MAASLVYNSCMEVLLCTAGTELKKTKPTEQTSIVSVNICLLHCITVFDFCSVAVPTVNDAHASDTCYVAE